MRNIKTYEDFQQYNIGDYVVLSQKNIWTCYAIVKIARRHNYDSNYYYVEALTFLPDMKRIENFWIEIEDIERLATSEEIEKFEVLISAAKYNL
jgi:hypothetical protein